MPLSFDCPACGHHLDAPDAAAGKTGDCKFCKAKLVAPSAPGEPARCVEQPGATLETSQPSNLSTQLQVSAPVGGSSLLPSPDPNPGAAAPPAPGYPPPDYELPGYIPPGGGHIPPFDPMAIPKVRKEFMCVGRPAVADFWKRVLAFGIDLTIIYGLQSAVAFLWAGTGGVDTLNPLASVRRQFDNMLHMQEALFAVRVLYGAILEGSPLQATVGKAVLGMKVCTEPGGKVTFLNALWRNFVKWVIVGAVSFVPIIGICPYIIFAYATQDDLTQTLHDMMAGTVVAERYW